VAATVIGAANHAEVTIRAPRGRADHRVAGRPRRCLECL